MRDGEAATRRDFEPLMEKLLESVPLISATYRERRLVRLDASGYLSPEKIMAQLQSAESDGGVLQF